MQMRGPAQQRFPASWPSPSALPEAHDDLEADLGRRPRRCPAGGAARPGHVRLTRRSHDAHPRTRPVGVVRDGHLPHRRTALPHRRHARRPRPRHGHLAGGRNVRRGRRSIAPYRRRAAAGPGPLHRRPRGSHQPTAPRRRRHRPPADHGCPVGPGVVRCRPRSPPITHRTQQAAPRW